jgi:tetratricopeptide (TPR) repeat protein
LLFLVVDPGCGRQEQVGPAIETSQGLTIPKVLEKKPPSPPNTTEDGRSIPSRAPTQGSKQIVVVPPRREVLARLRPRDPEVGTNLLGLPGVTFEGATVTGTERAALAALADDDPNTVAVASAAPEAPLEVVYRFGDATVTPERWIILLPPQAPPGAATARVEILVSTLSPYAGFQSVRADVLTPGARIQEFAFHPSAARWVVLRFTPPPGSTHVAIAEVAVLGRGGPPQSRYAFKESPARALDVLNRLKAVSALDIAISDDEAALFEDARDGRLDRWSFADAALLASDGRDPVRRKSHLDQLNALEAEAQAEVADANTPLERGQKLLNWTHARPMAGGYAAGQTDLGTILDTRTFNCVSSATLYNVLGLRLGLNLRAIQVPDHAFSILYEGKDHADVETTTPAGFNPARDPIAQEAFRRQTGFAYIPDSNRDQRREVGEVGLIALTYYNHGVTQTRAKQYHEALLSYFRALSLDPELSLAVQNALAVLAGWSAELAIGDEYSKALEVLATGLDLAPRDAALLHYRKQVWGLWAVATLDRGHDDEALDLLRKAAAAVPDEAAHFLAMQAWVYIRRGEKDIEAVAWERALAATKPGLDKLDGQPRRELAQWRAGVHLRWSQAEREKQRFEEALAVLDRGTADAPDDPRFRGSLAIVIQEWARATYEGDRNQGETKARQRLTALLTRYRGIAEAGRGAQGYVHGVVKSLCDARKFDDALAFVGRHSDLLGGDSGARAVILAVYDAHVGSLVTGQKWEEAVRVCEAALRRYPNEGHLRNTLGGILHEWLKDAYGKGPEEGKALMATLLSRFGDRFDLKDPRSFARSEVHRLQDAEDFREAENVLDRYRDLVGDEADVKDMFTRLYDNWAAKLMKVKDWDGALAVYVQGLKRFAGDDHLTHNLLYTMQEWLRDVLASPAGEPGAREVLATLRGHFLGIPGVDDIATGHVQRVVARLRDARRFEDALRAIEGHAHLLRDRDEAHQLSLAVYDAWASQLRTSHDWDGAVDVLEQALRRYPRDQHLENNLIYSVQEGARDLEARSGEEKAREFLARHSRKFRSLAGMGDVVAMHVQRGARRLSGPGKYEDALACIDRHIDLFDDRDKARSLAISVYDDWAESLRNKNDWEGAVGVYEKGLQSFVGDEHLTHNEIVNWDKWAKVSMDREDWGQAIKIYERALDRFPKDGLLRNNLEVCQERLRKASAGTAR